jgi:hypothetical protein
MGRGRGADESLDDSAIDGDYSGGFVAVFSLFALLHCAPGRSATGLDARQRYSPHEAART